MYYKIEQQENFYECVIFNLHSRKDKSEKKWRVLSSWLYGDTVIRLYGDMSASGRLCYFMSVWNEIVGKLPSLFFSVSNQRNEKGIWETGHTSIFSHF